MQSNDKDKVIVMGCHVSGLAVIRTLGRMDIEIIAMTYTKTDFADVSKYVSEKVLAPHPDNEKGFIEFLISNAHRWPGALILDTGDYFAVSLAKHKEILKKYYKIVTPDWSILKQFIEKQETSRVAQEAGVPHPQTFSPNSLDQLAEITEQVMYPCIMKPIYSHEFVSKFGTKNFQVNNQAELFDKFQVCLDAEQPVIVQEIIPGPDTELYRLQAYVNSCGKMSAKFFNNKIRQHPPQFGVMRVGVSTERNEQVERLSEKLLKQANYKGYCSIEFRKDPRDNQFKLIEVNVRMPRSGQLAIASRVNFPYIIYLDLVKNRQVEITDYQTETYWLELHTDLINILFRHNKEQFSLADYVSPYFAKNRTFAIWAKDDWMPFLKRSIQLPFLWSSKKDAV